MFRVSINFENVTFWRLKFVKIHATEYVVYRRLLSQSRRVGSIRNFLKLKQVLNPNSPVIVDCIVKGETELNVSDKEWFELFSIFIY